MRSIACGVLAAVSVIVGCSADAASGGATAGAGGSSLAGGGASGGGASGTSGGLAGTAGLTGSSGGGAGGTGGLATGGTAGGGTAGSGGSAGASGGAAGAAGSAGAAGAGGGSGLAGAIPSAGCNMTAAQALETFVEHDLTVGEYQRSYFVRLPTGYDPTRAYPLLIIGPGCGGSGDNAIPVQDEAGADAIVVGLNISAEVAGRDCFMTESPESPELDYFDAMWAEVSAGYCVDTARVLYGGFSSGAWLAHLFGCARSNILRAQGNVAGGPAPIPECAGPVAAIMIHDENDGANGIEGGEAARARILEQNGCTGDATMAWDAAYPMCQVYTGCPAEYPVVWCQTSGVNHDPQNDLSAPLFWKFLMDLPAEPLQAVPFVSAGQ